MKKIYLLIIVGIFFLSFTISLTSAVESLGEIGQNECIELTQICANCTYNNISAVQYPVNRSNIISEVAMTKTGTFYNYTFCSTGITGNYLVTGYGDPEGIKTIWTYDFNVTPLGKLGVLIFLVVLAFSFIGLGVGLKVPPLGFIGSILLILSGMYVMIYGLCDVANLYTRGIAITLLGLGFILATSSAYEWLSWQD